jgi:hypothetical protein
VNVFIIPGRGTSVNKNLHINIVIVIVEAVVARDPEAARQAMHQHLLKMKTGLKEARPHPLNQGIDGRHFQCHWARRTATVVI